MHRGGANRAPSTSQAANKGFPCRFFLPGGEKVGMGCNRSETFGAIKDKIWQRKGWKTDKKDYTVAIKDTELYFTDDDHFARLIQMAPVYRESATESILEASLIPVADVGDKLKRQNKRPADDGVYIIQGTLYKRGRTKNSSWKRRYFVLDNYTLFYFDSETEFFNKEAAIDFIPLGSCQAVRIDESYKNKSFCFELRAEHLDRRDFVLWTETEEDLEKWLKAIYSVNFRRVKTISIHCMEELERRRALGVEGIFRISGSQAVVQQLKKAYDNAEYPNLAECKDDNAIAGLMKLAIRELSECILTFSRYQAFIDLGNLAPANRVEPMIDLINSLPQSNRGFLAVLMVFIYKVSLHAETSMMTPKNLAIVFAPNLLRPFTETADTAINDTQNVLACIQSMIENAPTIFADEFDRTDKQEDAHESSSDSDDEHTPLPSRHSNSGSGPPPNRASTSVKALASPRSQVSTTLSPPTTSRPLDRVSEAPPPSVSMSANPLLAGALSPRSTNTVPTFAPPSTAPPGANAAPASDAARPGHKPSTSSMGMGVMIGGKSMLDELRKKQQGGGGAAGGVAGLRPTAHAAATPEPAKPVSGVELMLSRKAQEELHAQWEKKYAERKSAIQKEWTNITTALSLGGEPSAAIHDKFKVLMATQEKLQQQQLQSFDDVLRTLNSLTQDINASKQRKEAEAAAAAARGPSQPAADPARARMDSMPPPPPPRHSTGSVGPPPLPGKLAPPRVYKTCVAQFDYPGGHRADEIVFKEGEKIEVLDDADTQGWWQGRLNDKVGWFPASYVA